MKYLNKASRYIYEMKNFQFYILNNKKNMVSF